MRKVDWYEMQDLRNNSSVFDNFEDEKRYDAPENGGLYCISNTLFNPITEEKFYAVKVGVSKNLTQRMKSYRTTNPMVYHIDFWVEDNSKDAEMLERICHAKMIELGFVRLKDAYEWFLVDAKTYILICDLGFQYFFEDEDFF